MPSPPPEADSTKAFLVFFAMFLLGLLGVGAILGSTEGLPVVKRGSPLILLPIMAVGGAIGASVLGYQLHRSGMLQGCLLKTAWILTTVFLVLFILGSIGGVVWLIRRLSAPPT